MISTVLENMSQTDLMTDLMTVTPDYKLIGGRGGGGGGPWGVTGSFCEWVCATGGTETKGLGNP